MCNVFEIKANVLLKPICDQALREQAQEVPALGGLLWHGLTQPPGTVLLLKTRAQTLDGSQVPIFAQSIKGQTKEHSSSIQCGTLTEHRGI